MRNSGDASPALGLAECGIGNRRPLRTRARPWAQGLARVLEQAGLSPNAISVAGVGFAGAAAAAMMAAPGGGPLCWVAAVAGIQLRLLANMMDGMVAIEGGHHSATGALFNEFPDRIEDSVLLVSAGYATGNPALGWLAALLACTTAYVRVLGVSLGYAQDYGGPQAKPQRMAALSVAALACTICPVYPAMGLALAAISAGTLATLVLRTHRLARRMRHAQS